VLDRRNIAIASPSTGQEECDAVTETLRSGWLTQGPKVAAFEKAFAHRHTVKHAIAASNCTCALHLILTALGVKAGDEVIVPSFTWVASANAVVYCGATPIFADVLPGTYNLDPASVAAKVTKRTKAIMAVHLFGLCADMDAIKRAAPGIPLVEDAACAAGSAYKGKAAGSLGVAAAFSFHARKSITTGEGGMVTTNDDGLAHAVTSLRNHGASISEEERHRGTAPYLLPEFDVVGFNYRMTDLQGAVGLAQLKKLDGFVGERQQWAAFYKRELANVPWLRLPEVPEGYTHAWQSHVCMVDENKLGMSRNKLMAYLQDKGISTRPGTHAVHSLGYYKRQYKLSPEDFPISWNCNQHSMAIPLHNKMSAEDYTYVVEVLRAI